MAASDAEAMISSVNSDEVRQLTWVEVCDRGLQDFAPPETPELRPIVSGSSPSASSSSPALLPTPCRAEATGSAEPDLWELLPEAAPHDSAIASPSVASSARARDPGLLGLRDVGVASLTTRHEHDENGEVEVEATRRHQDEAAVAWEIMAWPRSPGFAASASASNANAQVQTMTDSWVMSVSVDDRQGLVESADDVNHVTNTNRVVTAAGDEHPSDLFTVYPAEVLRRSDVDAPGVLEGGDGAGVQHVIAGAIFEEHSGEASAPAAASRSRDRLGSDVEWSEVPTVPQQLLPQNLATEAIDREVMDDPRRAVAADDSAASASESQALGQTLCIVCVSATAVATFVHGLTGHTACCLSCAQEVQRRGRSCPVCRVPFTAVIRNFVST